MPINFFFSQVQDTMGVVLIVAAGWGDEFLMIGKTYQKPHIFGNADTAACG